MKSSGLSGKWILSVQELKNLVANICNSAINIYFSNIALTIYLEYK